MKKKSFIGGAIILMLAGFVVRILGFVYRIYLSNLIGAEGMGLFQLIMPLYSLIILTLTAGISISVSKMTAEELAKGHHVNIVRITRCALAVVISAGAVVSVFMYININFIVNVILKDSRTYYSILLLIPCIPVIAAASALKGYFYGIQNVVPTAWSQIMEQVVRIGLVIAMAGYFVKAGLDYACALATVGMAFGEISNLLVLYIVYRVRKTRDIPKSRSGIRRKRSIMVELVKTSVPISFNRFISSIMYAIEIILIPRRFMAAGMTYQASIEEFGRLAGMAMPLIFFPALVTSSLATTLVPAISEALSLKNFKAVNHRISKSIQITFVLGFIFTAIFLCYPNQIGDMLYKKQNIGNILFPMAFTCIFMYLQQTLLGVLNGLGKQGISLRNSVIGYAIRIAFVYYCIPSYGIKGYICGIVISSAIVCILNLATVVRMTGMSINLGEWIVRPCFVGVIMVVIGKYIYSFFTLFKLSAAWTTLGALASNIFIAIFLMAMAGALDRKELFRIMGLDKAKR